VRGEDVRQFALSAIRTCAAIMLALVCCAAAAADIDVQGVEGSTKAKDGVPASLGSYKKILQDSEMTSFKDLGKKSVSGAAGSTGSLAVGSFTVELEVKSADGAKSTVVATIKEDGKAKFTPTQYALSKGESKSFELPSADKKAKIIVILTLRD
jgi:hypothetical protein